MSRPRPHLVVMLKEPRPGRVKTRLARDIGAIDAAWWFRHQSLGLLRRVTGPGWRTSLAVSPDCAGCASRIWPAHLPRLPQGPGDLGQRMGRLLRLAPPGPVAIIGADIPGITRAHIAGAFHALHACDAVIGPAEDGGYWLIGLARRRAPPAGLFAGVRWSTPHALADTLATLSGHRLAILDGLRDVDALSDLRAFAGHSRAAPEIGRRATARP